MGTRKLDFKRRKAESRELEYWVDSGGYRVNKRRKCIYNCMGGLRAGISNAKTGHEGIDSDNAGRKL